MKEIRETLEVLLAIWKAIEFEQIPVKIKTRIYDYFADRIHAAAMHANSYENFIELLCRKMNASVPQLPDVKDPDAILEQCREIPIFLVAALREEIFKKGGAA